MRVRQKVSRFTFAATVFFAAAAFVPALTAQPAAPRPMTFLDMQLLKQISGLTPSPDGQWLLYTLSTPDWKEARRQTDLYLVSIQQGLGSTRQLTFTKEKNETSPAWARDGRSFFFLSNREAPESASGRNQIYVMRPDGGEARRVTDAKEGVSNFTPSPDGRWLVYRSGKSGEEQLYRLPIANIDTASPETLTTQPAAVGTWRWSADSKRIYFTTANAVDADDKARREKKFTVNIRNAETPLVSLWALDLNPVKAARLTTDTTFSVSDFTISDDGKWLAFRGGSANRYERNITQEGLYADLWLLDTTSGQLERLTSNREVSESAVSFSPDSKWIAFSAPDDLEKYSKTNRRLYVRGVGDRGKPFRKLGAGIDGDVTTGFWSKDGGTIYFNEGIKATNQLMAIDVAADKVRQITSEKASLTVERHDSGVLLIEYSDGATPATVFTAASVEQIGNRGSWKQLTDANPQVKQLTLGTQEEISWKSKDGTVVGVVTVATSVIGGWPRRASDRRAGDTATGGTAARARGRTRAATSSSAAGSAPRRVRSRSPTNPGSPPGTGR